MTIRMDVYYRAPQDPDAFEKRYIEGHLPLIGKYEKIKSFTFGKVTRVLQGDYPYAYQFTGTWASKDDCKADLSSRQAKTATEDAQQFATQGFDVVVFEELA
ncbi:MAG: EthD family reductase [Actinomycetota bacterium]